MGDPCAPVEYTGLTRDPPGLGRLVSGEAERVEFTLSGEPAPEPPFAELYRFTFFEKVGIAAVAIMTLFVAGAALLTFMAG